MLWKVPELSEKENISEQNFHILFSILCLAFWSLKSWVLTYTTQTGKNLIFPFWSWLIDQSWRCHKGWPSPFASLFNISLHERSSLVTFFQKLNGDDMLFCCHTIWTPRAKYQETWIGSKQLIIYLIKKCKA